MVSLERGRECFVGLQYLRSILLVYVLLPLGGLLRSGLTTAASSMVTLTPQQISFTGRRAMVTHRLQQVTVSQ